MLFCRSAAAHKQYANFTMNMFELTFDILLSPFSDDNFGMACVIVHRIFIYFFFLLFPILLYMKEILKIS